MMSDADGARAAACRPVWKALAKRVSRSETSAPGSPTPQNTDATTLRAASAISAVRDPTRPTATGGLEGQDEVLTSRRALSGGAPAVT